MFFIDSRSRTPIYEQLTQNIISQITNGVLLPDEQLPSVRNLARDLGINPNTVQKSYQELESKGIIYQASGRGSFVADCQQLTKTLSDSKLESLRKPLTEAKLANVKLEGILALLKEIYKGVSK